MQFATISACRHGRCGTERGRREWRRRARRTSHTLPNLPAPCLLWCVGGDRGDTAPTPKAHRPVSSPAPSPPSSPPRPCAAERRVSFGKWYHPMCLKCHACGRILVVGSHAEVREGMLRGIAWAGAANGPCIGSGRCRCPSAPGLCTEAISSSLPAARPPRSALCTACAAVHPLLSRQCKRPVVLSSHRFLRRGLAPGYPSSPPRTAALLSLTLTSRRCCHGHGGILPRTAPQTHDITLTST